MLVEPQTIAAAKKLKPAAVSQLLQSQVAQVYRISYALSGRWDSGKALARFVMNRSVAMMPKFDPDDDPANWFHRFTVMTSRRQTSDPPAAAKDVLVEQAASPADTAYIAFVAALRQLNPQQREAFLLWHGEKLNPRYCALAMDCSTQAAENHLKAAEQSMHLVAGPAYEVLLRKLIDAYQHLTPETDELKPTVNGVVFRRVKLRRVWRIIVTLVALVVMVASLWGAWKIYHYLQG